MGPHMRVEDTVQILQFDRVWVHFGPAKDNLPHKLPLQKDITLHIHQGDWHVVEYEKGSSLEFCLSMAKQQPYKEENQT